MPIRSFEVLPALQITETTSIRLVRRISSTIAASFLRPLAGDQPQAFIIHAAWVKAAQISSILVFSGSTDEQVCVYL